MVVLNVMLYCSGSSIYAYQRCSTPVRFSFPSNMENSHFHGDCKYDNILMDPTGLYSVLPHPLRPHLAPSRDFQSAPSHTTRTLAPVKYYFIDFGVAKKYDLSAPPEERLEPPGWGAGDGTIPEFKKDELSDPFAVDVYCIGHLIQSHFLDVRISISRDH